MKIFVLAFLLLGCTGDHVVGSTADAAASGGAGGSGGSSGAGGAGGSGGTGGTGGMMIDASTIDAPPCGMRGQPCCTTGRICDPGLHCNNNVCN